MSQQQGIPFILGNMTFNTPVIRRVQKGITVYVEYNGKTVSRIFGRRSTIEDIVSTMADSLNMAYNLKDDKHKFTPFINGVRVCWTYHILYYSKRFNIKNNITINVLDRAPVQCFRNTILNCYSATDIQSLVDDLNQCLWGIQWYENWEDKDYQKYLAPPQPQPQPKQESSDDDSTFDDESE